MPALPSFKKKGAGFVILSIAVRHARLFFTVTRPGIIANQISLFVTPVTAVPRGACTTGAFGVGDFLVMKS